MAGLFGFNEIAANSGYWAGGTRAVTVSGDGSTTAAFPATNIFTRNPAQYFERAGCSTGSVTLQIELQTVFGTAAENRINVGLFGLIGLQGMDLLGREYSLNVRLRTSNTNFAACVSAPQVDKTRTLYQADFYGMQPRQVFAPYMDSGGITTAWKDAGGLRAYRYNQLDISAVSPATTWYLRIGRLVMMTALHGGIERFPGREFADDTQVVKAFSGMPFALKKAPLRRFDGKFNSLNDAQVYGRASNEPGSTSAVFACLNTINRTTGRAGDVCILPSVLAETVSSGRYLSGWQTQPIFGILENNLAARRVETAVAPGTTTRGGLWEADVAVTEMPTF